MSRRRPTTVRAANSFTLNPMIDDQELWALFRAEAEEHLQLLDAGLLRLEKDAGNPNTIEAIFRSAHSLKGTARMMAADEIQNLAHVFEDALLGAVRRGEQLEEAVIEQLYAALDALRASVMAALSGQTQNTSPKNSPISPQAETISGKNALISEQNEGISKRNALILEQNEGISERNEGISKRNGSVSEQNGSVLERNETVPKQNEDVPKQNGNVSEQNGDVSEQNASVAERDGDVSSGIGTTSALAAGATDADQTALAPAWKIETMRVNTARLDGLLSMAGELVVSTKRAARAKAEIERVQELREEALKLRLDQKRVLRAIEAELGDKPIMRELERLFEGLGAKWEQAGAVTDRMMSAQEDMARLENVVGDLEAAIRAVRLLPLSTLFGQFPRSVRDLAKLQGKRVELVIEGAETLADKRVLEELKDPLMHMVRNAVDHGIETPETRTERGKTPAATLVLRGSQSASHVNIELEDDGRGLDVKAIGASALKKGLVSASELEAMTARQIQDLIFAPGFSTAAQVTDVSGRGVGLDVARENVARLRGTIEVESRPGRGCTFRLILPLTLATTRVLLVRARGQTFALSIERVARVFLLERGARFSLQSRPNFSLDGEPVPFADLGDLLQIPANSGRQNADEAVPCVVLSEGGERLGLCVDAVIEEQEIILKPPCAALEHLRHVAGATILETGDVCLLLAPAALMALAHNQGVARAPQSAVSSGVPSERAQAKSLLLVEDSLVTRTQEKRILENAGYVVTTAVDGLDGWGKLVGGEFDGIVSDVEMPHLNGFDLTARVRSQPKYDELPVVLVTSLASDADRRRGLEVGANAYIAKGDFDQKALLETLKLLV